jgi:hypothetical protein
MFRARKYRRQVAESLNEALRSIHVRVEAAGADDRMRIFLGQAAQAQAHALLDFAVRLRRDEALKPFVSMMQVPDAAHRALRIATWALVLQVPRTPLRRRYPAVVKTALPALGVESEWEHRLVYFEPTAVEDMQGFQFDRYTLEGLLAATTGIEDHESLPWIILWTSELNAAIEVLIAAMAVIDPEPPQPGFSRLSEVEAEIKARQQADSSAE